MYRTITSQRRRIGTAVLWTLTIWAGTDVVADSSGVAVEDALGLITGALIYLDPMHRIWPRRRVTVADLPRRSRILRREMPAATPEAQTRG